MRLGGDAGITYLTAYLLEKSLSVDNLFVFILIFSLTGIPARAAAPRAVLGHRRRAGHARRVDRRSASSSWSASTGSMYVFAGFLVVTRRSLLRPGRAETHLSRRAARSAELARATPADPCRRPRARSSSCAKAGAGWRTPLLVALVGDRDHRPRLRGRLDPRGVRGHARPVPRLHVEHLRAARAALAVLPAGGRDPQAALPAHRARGHAAARRGQARLGESYHVPPWLRCAVVAVIFTVAIVASLLLPEKQRMYAPTATRSRT